MGASVFAAHSESGGKALMYAMTERAMEMLEKDKVRLTAIHQAIDNVSTAYTRSGKLTYYFDANGRYEKKETLLSKATATRTTKTGMP